MVPDKCGVILDWTQWCTMVGVEAQGRKALIVESAIST